MTREEIEALRTKRDAAIAVLRGVIHEAIEQDLFEPSEAGDCLWAMDKLAKLVDQIHNFHVSTQGE